jgi:uncharacterized protein (TIGR03435 family)
MTTSPAGVVYTNVSLSECLEHAYGVRPFQIIGPDWVRTDRYVVNARTERAATDDEIKTMLQALLIERFQMTLHREHKTLPALALTVGKNGHRLKSGDANGPRRMEFVGGSLMMVSTSMGELADFLSQLPTVALPVIDRTGLNGRFDFPFQVSFAQRDDTAKNAKLALAGGDISVVRDALDGVGLKLDPQREPIEIILIDRANRVPIQN